MIYTDDHIMNAAIAMAAKNGTPYGCALFNEKTTEIRAYPNTTKVDGKTAHAEMNALRNLDQLSYEHIEDLVLFSTAEPCPMCMGAIIWAGIKKVRYGISIIQVKDFHNQIQIGCAEIAAASWKTIDIQGGIREQACYDTFKELA